MQLIIDATTLEELVGKVNELAARFNVDFSKITTTPITQEVVEEAKVVEIAEEDKAHYIAEVVEAPKKEKKAKKEKVDVEVTTAEEAKVTLPENVTVALTKQDIANACQAVSEKHGLDKAREILAKFDGARRISDVKESDYAKFIAECKAL